MHGSNGRIKRVIGTFKECLIIRKEEKLEKKIIMFNNSQNSTYHSTVERSPKEALKRYDDIAPITNNMVNRKMKKRKGKRGDKTRQDSHRRYCT